MFENIIREIRTVFDHNGDPLEVQFFMLGSEGSFTKEEFLPGSNTRIVLEQIEELILYGKPSPGAAHA